MYLRQKPKYILQIETLFSFLPPSLPRSLPASLSAFVCLCSPSYFSFVSMYLFFISTVFVYFNTFPCLCQQIPTPPIPLCRSCSSFSSPGESLVHPTAPFLRTRPLPSSHPHCPLQASGKHFGPPSFTVPGGDRRSPGLALPGWLDKATSPALGPCHPSSASPRPIGTLAD